VKAAEIEKAFTNCDRLFLSETEAMSGDPNKAIQEEAWRVIKRARRFHRERLRNYFLAVAFSLCILGLLVWLFGMSCSIPSPG
jgi:hypothetical protein